ncbi:MAG: sigma-70 family RNA polymerase sigma factor [Clostridia bacterium]|nr:sigma-70 family RNA polymerase sigma factor [Clostridia bacterium]
MISKTKDFSQSTDETLVALAREGSLQAQSCIIERYRDSVRMTAASNLSRFGSCCSLSSIEFDDLFQEGLLGLMSAIYSFKEDKNVTFRTYAAKCISNSIKTAIKTSIRKKNTPPGGIVSLDDIDIPERFSLEDKIISAEGTKRIYDFFKNGLSVLENKVIRMHLSGLSYKEIADTLGISEKSADNAIQRVRGKLSKFLNTNRS